MDVVITDHHSPRADGQLPRAPIVRAGVCGYPMSRPVRCGGRVQAGAGAVRARAPRARARGPRARSGARCRSRTSSRTSTWSALATIADVVALLGENRTLARRAACAAWRAPPKPRPARTDGAQRRRTPAKVDAASGRVSSRLPSERRRAAVPRRRRARAAADRGPRPRAARWRTSSIRPTASARRSSAPSATRPKPR